MIFFKDNRQGAVNLKYGVGRLMTALALLTLAPALVLGLSGGYVFAQEVAAEKIPTGEAGPAQESTPQMFPRIPHSATALTLDGETVSLEKYRGKLVFLVVWRTDCKACLFEIPTLNKLQEEFGGEDFTVLGLSVDKDKDEFVRKVIEVRGINYPVWMGYGQPLSRYTATEYLPTLFTIGPEGELLGYLPGAFPSYEDAVAVVEEARRRASENGASE